MSRTWACPVFPLPSLDGGRSDGHGSEIGEGGFFSDVVSDDSGPPLPADEG